MGDKARLNDEAKSGQCKATLICLVITQLFYILLLPGWALFSLVLLLVALDTDVYDRANLAARFFAWSLFAWLAFYPIVSFISAIASWVLYKRDRHRKSFVVNSIPLALLSIWLAIFVPLSIRAHPASFASIPQGWWPWVVVVFFAIAWIVWILMAKVIGLFPIRWRQSRVGK
jgi:hypothetical protein